MTKVDFYIAYRAKLVATYPWAANVDKLERFMNGVEETLNGGSRWNHDGEAVTAAWRAIGGKGKPTLKALRALIG